MQLTQAACADPAAGRPGKLASFGAAAPAAHYPSSAVNGFKAVEHKGGYRMIRNTTTRTTAAALWILHTHRNTVLIGIYILGPCS